MLKNYEEDVYDALHDLPSDKKFVDAVSEFRASETSRNMVADYKRTYERIDMKKEADAPIKTLKNVIYELNSIELDPYITANSTQAKAKLIEIKGQLQAVEQLVQDLLEAID